PDETCAGIVLGCFGRRDAPVSAAAYGSSAAVRRSRACRLAGRALAAVRSAVHHGSAYVMDGVVAVARIRQGHALLRVGLASEVRRALSVRGAVGAAGLRVCTAVGHAAASDLDARTSTIALRLGGVDALARGVPAAGTLRIERAPTSPIT